MSDQIEVTLHTAEDNYLWYVVFTPGCESFWWQRLLKPGFRHCYAVRDFKHGSVIIAHHGHRLDVRHSELPALEYAFSQVIGGYKVVSIDHKPNPVSTHRTIMTCVSTVICAIGFRGMVALTPYSLYRALLSRGGYELESVL